MACASVSSCLFLGSNSGAELNTVTFFNGEVGRLCCLAPRRGLGDAFGSREPRTRLLVGDEASILDSRGIREVCWKYAECSYGIAAKEKNGLVRRIPARVAWARQCKEHNIAFGQKVSFEEENFSVPE